MNLPPSHTVILSRELLIANKEAPDRPQDLADVEVLKRRGSMAKL